MNVIHSSLPKADEKAKSNNALLFNLYNDVPKFELSLDEFEVYALKRLKVLKKIEELKMTRVPQDQAHAKINQLIKQELSDPNIDEASHFILRLSYCQSEELRRWFLQHECLLLYHRLQNLSEQQLATSVRRYCQVKPIPKDQKEQLQQYLMPLTNPTEFATSTFYAVPFQQALDLVTLRQCYLHAGYAYIPQARVLTILVAKFRTQLSRQLAIMGHAGTFDQVDNPEHVRIKPLLKNMNQVLVNPEPTMTETALSQSLNASNLVQFVPNMPLCMRQLQAGLEHDKKLRHWGRLQYGLFLKGAGLSMDDALFYMQRHFTLVTGEQFQKQYSYGIRHMYGKEGKRATYTPYSCPKIIMGLAAPSSAVDHHGCPYKHYDGEHLEQVLQKLQIGSTPKDRAAILSLQKSKQYNLACRKHFEVMHPQAVSMGDISLDNVGNHPNAWFRASAAYTEKMAETKDEKSP